MLDAFSSETVLDHAKHTIVALHAYSNRLLLVDSQFTLLHYQVSEHKSNHEQVSVRPDALKTVQTIKTFCKSRPVKMHAIKETGMLLVLVDSYLSIFSLSDLSLLQKLPTTKGATTFSVWSGVDHTSGIPILSTQVAVCVKRQLLLFTWLDSEFEGERHFDCPDRGKAVEFLTNQIVVVAMTNDFVTIDLEHDQVDALQLPIGGSLGTVSTTMGYLGTRAPRPILTRTSDQMLLVKDVQSVFIDKHAELLKTRGVGWGSAPEYVGYTYPYLIVVLKNRVEIRNATSGSILQSFDVAGVQFLNDGKSLFLATSHKVLRLNFVPYADQVEQLIDTNQLLEALSLLESLDSVLLDDKAGLIRRTKELVARELFEKQDFDGSMDMFGESWTRPSIVVELLPQEDTSRATIVNTDANSNQDESNGSKDVTALETSIIDSRSSLDESIRNAQKVTEIVSAIGDLQTATAKAALRSLSTFLARSRRLLSRFLSSPPSPTSEEQYFTSWPQCRPLTADEMEIELGVADTALLRIYILSSPGLVGSLVRLANRCDPDVVKDYLVKENRWKELVDFYYGKQLHRDALALLREKNAVAMGIQYLQRLDVQEWNVIKEFAPWVLQNAPENPDTELQDIEKTDDAVAEDLHLTQTTSAMDIFTDSSRESNSFDRSEVAAFLTTVDKTFGAEYLEHLVLGCNDTTPHFSEDLIYIYIEMSRIADLLGFLESPQNSANPARIFTHVPYSSSFDEVRAIVLADMDNLEKALQIMVTKVRNPHKTEAFAAKQFKKDEKSFEMLLALYLSTAKIADKPDQVYLEEALDLLQRHGPRLDADQVIASLPGSTSLSSIADYLKTRLRANLVTNYSSLIESKLREAFLLDLQTRVMSLRKKHWEVGVDRVCAVCHKRLGNSVLAVFPDGACVHYGCQHRYRPSG